MMRVLQACAEDLAGTAISLKQAIERHTVHECRAIRDRDNYIGYQADVESTDKEVWREWTGWADLIHVHEYIGLYQRVRHLAPGKPIVWHLHGTFFKRHRAEVNHLLDTQRIRAVVATPELLQLCPTASWLPLALDLPRLAAYRNPNGGFRVVQTPTWAKGKPPVLDPDMELEVVRHVPHEEALRRKGRASAVFDQFAGPVGQTRLHTAILAASGLEAMAMGIPVLAGGPEETLLYYRMFWGCLPFLPTTPEELLLHLRALKENPSLSEHWSQRGLDHVRQFHDEAKVAAQATALYEEVLGAK